jgi:hypothetical protein
VVDEGVFEDGFAGARLAEDEAEAALLGVDFEDVEVTLLVFEYGTMLAEYSRPASLAYNLKKADIIGRLAANLPAGKDTEGLDWVLALHVRVLRLQGRTDDAVARLADYSSKFPGSRVLAAMSPPPRKK